MFSIQYVSRPVFLSRAGGSVDEKWREVLLAVFEKFFSGRHGERLCLIVGAKMSDESRSLLLQSGYFEIPLEILEPEMKMCNEQVTTYSGWTNLQEQE